MSRTLKITALVIGALFLLGVVREAFFGYDSYFVIIPGAKLYADGKPASGWLHRGNGGHTFILTRSLSAKRESYWISLPGEKGGWVGSCPKWAASRFPLVAINDLFPCDVFGPPEGIKSPARGLGLGRDFWSSLPMMAVESERLGERLNQNGEDVLGALHRTIERIALDRLTAGFADQADQFAAAQVLAGGRAGVVINALFD